MSKFVRPENIKFPLVYHEFRSKKDENIKFKVQDLPEEYFEDAIDLLAKHFMPEETFCVAKNVQEDKEVQMITREFYREIFKKKLSVGCFCEDSKELIAVNIMDTKSNDDEKLEFPNKKIIEIMEVVDFADKQFNPCDVFQVETCLTSYALVVHPTYRGLGIATEMLKARGEMLKAFDLKVTSTMFTTIGSQIAAAKANYEESWTMSYDELTKMFPTFDFSKASSRYLKKMSLKI